GCVLIDVGAAVTSVLVFHDGIIQYVDAIPMGGQNLTRNIAQKLNLNYELAEEIKRSYGTAIASQIQEEEILVKRDNAYLPIKHQEIYDAIHEDVDDFVLRIDTSIRKSHLYEHLGAGIKMIGGGALLPGLIERIEGQTQLSVSLAQIQKLTPRNVSNAAMFATAISVAHRGWEYQNQGTLSAQQHVEWGQRLINKVKELYFEYF
ncbi:MAG: cell division FtsA domain-containing protein, partial [Candidatus Omnitrophica bacterium]|nr:cell division FtsA domain-containing protein [Candidatus Omnitrophota bacterium]